MTNNVRLFVVFMIIKKSQMNPAVVDSIIKGLTKHFGELSITRGKGYTFLCMNIKIRDDKKI